MANSITHASLRTPIRGAKYTVELFFATWVDDPLAFAAYVSKDGAAFAACTESLDVINGLTNGSAGYLTLTAAEMTADILQLAIYDGRDGSQPSFLEIRPANLPVLASGVAAAGAAGSVDLAASASGYEGQIVMLTSGTGAGQARHIKSVSGVAVNVPTNWETNPVPGTGYEILQLNAVGGSGSAPSAADVALAVWTYVTRTLTSGVNISLAKGVNIFGFNDLSQANVRTALGMSTDDLDTQLDTILALIDTEIATIIANIAALPSAATTAAAVRTNLTTELGRIDVATSTRLATAGYTSPLDAAATRAAIGLAAANIDAQFAALPTAASAAEAVMDALVESGFTVRGVLQILSAAIAGITATAGQNPEIYRNLGNTKDRISVANDSSGNRITVTLDLDP